MCASGRGVCCNTVGVGVGVGVGGVVGVVEE